MPPEDFNLEELLAKDVKGPSISDIMAQDPFGKMLSGFYTEAEIAQMTHAVKKEKAYALAYGGKPEGDTVPKYHAHGYTSVINNQYTYIFGTVAPKGDNTNVVFVNTGTKAHWWGKGLKDGQKQWELLDESHNPGEDVVNPIGGCTKDSPEGPMMYHWEKWKLMTPKAVPEEPESIKPTGVWYYVDPDDKVSVYQSAEAAPANKVMIEGTQFLPHQIDIISRFVSGEWKFNGKNFTIGEAGTNAGDVWTMDGKVIWLRTEDGGAKVPLWDAAMYEGWLKTKFSAINLCAGFFHEASGKKYWFGAEPQGVGEEGFNDYANIWVGLDGKHHAWHAALNKWVDAPGFHWMTLPVDLTLEMVNFGDTYYLNGKLYRYELSGWQPMQVGAPVKKVADEKSAKSVKLYQGYGRHYVVTDHKPDMDPFGPMTPKHSYWADTSTGKIYAFMPKYGNKWQVTGALIYSWGEPVPSTGTPGSLYADPDGGLEIWAGGKWNKMTVVPVDELPVEEIKLFGGAGRRYLVGAGKPTVTPKTHALGTKVYWVDTTAMTLSKFHPEMGWQDVDAQVFATPEKVIENGPPKSEDLLLSENGLNTIKLWVSDFWMAMGPKKIPINAFIDTTPTKTKEAEMPKKPAVELRKYDGGKTVPRIYYVGDVAPKEVPSEGEKKIYWVCTKDNKIYKWNEGDWIHAHYYTVRDSVDTDEKEDGDVVLGNGTITVFKWGSWTKLDSVPMNGGQVPEPAVEIEEPSEPAVAGTEYWPTEGLQKFYHHYSSVLAYVADYAPAHVKDNVYMEGHLLHKVDVYWIDTVTEKVWRRLPDGTWKETTYIYRSSLWEAAVDGDFVMDGTQLQYHYKGAYKPMAKETITTQALIKTAKNMMAGQAAAETPDVKLYKQYGHVIHYYVSAKAPEMVGAMGLPEDHEGAYFAQYWVNTEAMTMSYWDVSGKVWKSCSGMYTVYGDLDKAADDVHLGNILIHDGLVSLATGGNYVTMEEYDLNPAVLTLAKSAITPAGIQIFESDVFSWRYYVAETTPVAGVAKGNNGQTLFWINKLTGGFWRLNGATWETKNNDYYTDLAMAPDLAIFDVLHSDGKFKVWLSDNGVGGEKGWHVCKDATPAPVAVEYTKYQKPNTQLVYFVGEGVPKAKAVGTGHFWVDKAGGVIYRWYVKQKEWEKQDNKVHTSMVGLSKIFKGGDICLYANDGGVYVFTSGGFVKLKHLETVEAAIDLGTIADSAAPAGVEKAVAEYKHTQVKRKYFFGGGDPKPLYKGTGHVWVDLDAKKIWRWSPVNKTWTPKDNTFSIMHGQAGKEGLVAGPTPVAGDICLDKDGYWARRDEKWELLVPVGKDDFTETLAKNMKAFEKATEATKKLGEVLTALGAPKPELSEFIVETPAGYDVRILVSDKQPDIGMPFDADKITIWANVVTGEVWHRLSPHWHPLSLATADAKLDTTEDKPSNSVTVAPDWLSGYIRLGQKWVKMEPAMQSYDLKAKAEPAPMDPFKGNPMKLFKGKIMGNTGSNVVIYVSNDKPNPSIPKTNAFQFWVNPATGDYWERTNSKWKTMSYMVGYNLQHLTDWAVSVSPDHESVSLRYAGKWSAMELVGETVDAPKAKAEPVCPSKLFEGKVGGWAKTKIYIGVGIPDPSIGKTEGLETFWLCPTLGTIWERMPEGWKDHSHLYKWGFGLTVKGAPTSDWCFSIGKHAESLFVGIGGVWHQLAEVKTAAGVKRFHYPMTGWGGTTVYIGAGEPDPEIKKKHIVLWANPVAGKIWELSNDDGWGPQPYTAGYNMHQLPGYTPDNWHVSVNADHSKAYIWYNKQWNEMVDKTEEEADVIAKTATFEDETVAKIAAELSKPLLGTDVVWWQPKLPGYSRLYGVSDLEPDLTNGNDPRDYGQFENMKLFWIQPKEGKIFRKSVDGGWILHNSVMHHEGVAKGDVSMNSTLWNGDALHLWKNGMWHKMVPNTVIPPQGKLAGPGKLTMPKGMELPEDFLKEKPKDGWNGKYFTAQFNNTNRVYWVGSVEPKAMKMVDDGMLQFWADPKTGNISRWNGKYWSVGSSKVTVGVNDGKMSGSRDVQILQGKVYLWANGMWKEMKQWDRPVYSDPEVKWVGYLYKSMVYAVGPLTERPATGSGMYWFAPEQENESKRVSGWDGEKWIPVPNLHFHALPKAALGLAEKKGLDWHVYLKDGQMHFFNGKTWGVSKDPYTVEKVKKFTVGGSLLDNPNYKKVADYYMGKNYSVQATNANSWVDESWFKQKFLDDAQWGPVPKPKSISYPATGANGQVGKIDWSAELQPVIAVDPAKDGGVITSPGGWSVPKHQHYDVNEMGPVVVDGIKLVNTQWKAAKLAATGEVGDVVESGPVAKGSVLDHKGGKDVSVKAEGAILEPGDTVMVGASENTGKIVEVMKVVYFSHADKYYAAYELAGVVYSALPSELVLLKKGEKDPF